MKHTQFVSLVTIIVMELALFFPTIPAVYATPAALPEVPTATITVTTNQDNAAASDGLCTLREAITNANSDSDTTGGDCAAGSGTDTILFSIGVVSSTQTISPTDALPSITAPVVIDGWSQGGNGYTGPPLIELDGSNTSGFTRGLNITGGGSTVRGLVINSFSCDGVRLYDGDGNWIYANYIGTDVGGTVAQPNNAVNSCGGGIVIRDSITPSEHNIIGTNGDGVNDALEGNLISGNNQYGVQLDTDGNKIAGNYVGTDITGMADLGNSSSGVIIQTDALTNTVGADGDGVGDADEGNLISGNGQYGVAIFWDSGNNVVAGNYIGTDVNGTGDLGNTWSGVYVNDSPNTRIGTDGNGVSDILERNIISGNDDNGVYLYDNGSDYSVVAGNYIGVDVTGATALPNNGTGVRLDQADFTIIGTDGDGIADNVEGNIISGNGDDVSALNYNSGISFYTGASDNTIAGNIIGSDVSGMLDLGNYGYGIFLQQNSDGIIGTNNDGLSDDLEGNLISGNRYGIYESGSSPNTQNYIVAGNLIGTQADGASPLGNSQGGIVLIWGDLFTIYQNTIAHNGGDGISLNSGAISNTISANSIFSNTDLGIDLNANGVTLNDSGDPDTGANHLQNFPVIGLAESTVKGQTLITGTLNSISSTTFVLEFFYNDAADPSGYGEGQDHLGSADVSTDGSGDVTFSLTLSRTLPPDKYVTATATDPDGSTSEFSVAYGPAQGLLDDPITGLTATCMPSSCEVDAGTPLELDADIVGGTGVMYAWDFGDAWAASGQVVSHTYTNSGVYTATVTAHNNNDSQSASVSVTAIGATPVADAGSDQTVAAESLVTLDGSGSFDSEGNTPLIYAWSQTGGVAVTLSDSSVVFPTFTAPATTGVLTFTLVVTNSIGSVSAPDTVVITVTNSAPTANAGPDQVVTTGDLVALDGSGSTDPDNHLPLTYGWEQTGGTLNLITLSDSTVVSPTFTAPDVVRVFTFTLAVTDSLGLADSTPDEVVIAVRQSDQHSIYLPLVIRNSG